MTQLAYRCQKQKLPLAATAVVMSGLLDFDFRGQSFQYNAERDIVVPDRLKNIAHYYLPETVSRGDTELCPARQTYLTYPQTLFQVGDHEVLLDDSVSFFEAMRQQGHDVALQVVPGLLHVGQLFCRDFSPRQAAIDQAAAYLRVNLS